MKLRLSDQSDDGWLWPSFPFRERGEDLSPFKFFLPTSDSTSNIHPKILPYSHTWSLFQFEIRSFHLPLSTGRHFVTHELIDYFHFIKINLAFFLIKTRVERVFLVFLY